MLNHFFSKKNIYQKHNDWQGQNLNKHNVPQGDPNKETGAAASGSGFYLSGLCPEAESVAHGFCRILLVCCSADT